MYDDLLKLDRQLCFRLYTVSKSMTRLYQPILDRYQLTYPQYIVMLVLFEQRSIDFKDLSTMVDLKTGTLTPIVQKLEGFGYVKKVKNESDNRKITISLTKKGDNLSYDIINVPIQLASKLKLTEEMYTTLVKELDELLVLIKKATEMEESK